MLNVSLKQAAGWMLSKMELRLKEYEKRNNRHGISSGFSRELKQ